jgi:hypothetical protein
MKMKVTITVEARLSGTRGVDPFRMIEIPDNTENSNNSWLQ